MNATPSCGNAVLVSIPPSMVGNDLNTHDGYYSLVNEAAEAPVYVWRRRHWSRTPSDDIFLFRAANGAWVVGPNASQPTGKIQSNVFTALCPGDIRGNASWAYYDGGTAWSCTTWDEQCSSGSGITVEPQCVTVDPYATTGRDRFSFAPCTGSSPPPPPPTLPFTALSDKVKAADSAAGNNGLVIGIASAASVITVLFLCWFAWRWWRSMDDRAYGRRIRASSAASQSVRRSSSSSGGGGGNRSSNLHTGASRHAACSGLRPMPSPPRRPPAVEVRRERGSPGGVSQYSPTRLAALAQAHLDRHARRQSAYTGVELQPIAHEQAQPHRQPHRQHGGGGGGARAKVQPRRDQFV